VDKLRTTGLIIDKKERHKRRVLAEKLDNIGAKFEYTHRKSLRRLAQETEVSKSSARTTIKFLKLRPYITTVIHARLGTA
jgi:hypothetical protein